MKTSNLALAVLFVVAIASSAVAKENPDPPPVVLNVTITADNAYGFGFGPASGMTTFYGGIMNASAEDIFSNPPRVVHPGDIPTTGLLTGAGAEIYNLTYNPVAAQTHDYDYLYIAAWDDGDKCQGLIASFQRDNSTLLTGNGWSVFATGGWAQVPWSHLTADNLPAVNAQIQIANACAGGTNTSIGWVDQNGCVSGPDYPFVFRPAGPYYPKLEIGSKNSTVGAMCPYWCPDQPPVEGISPDARWMWYNSNNASDPFNSDSGNSSAQVGYLIFRLPVSGIGGTDTPEPSSLVLLGMGAIGFVAYVWRRRSKRGCRVHTTA